MRYERRNEKRKGGEIREVLLQVSGAVSLQQEEYVFGIDRISQLVRPVICFVQCIENIRNIEIRVYPNIFTIYFGF